MTEQVLHRTERGSVVAIGESAAERAERLERAAEDSAHRFVLTGAQRRALANQAP
jgi:hypothetical protein